MFDSSQYQLVDFGHGRKLERFAGLLVDRPSPAAGGAPKKDPTRWKHADARFDLAESRTGPARGKWHIQGNLPQQWVVEHPLARFDLKLTDFGHVGLFPEQAANWEWIYQNHSAATRAGQSPPRLLNLFAYTGGSTLAAARAGWGVTHVDASRSAVAWARQNAQLSGLADAPIRWIVDDALAFTRRELRRGQRYDAVILDPPTYGHGPRGQSWKIDSHLPELFTLCRQLTGPEPLLFLFTCHAPNYRTSRLSELLAASGFAPPGAIEQGELFLSSADRRLDAGIYARQASK